MGTWGAGNFQVKYERNPLQLIVNEFPPALKQAMYAAAERQTLKKGTWNGCAFNAAGDSVEAKVSSTSSAAEVFGVSTSLVGQFISIWDKFTAEEPKATEVLKRCLLKAGLFEEVGTSKSRIFGKRYVSQRVWESDKTKFDELMQANGISDFDIELADDLLVSV